MVNLTFYSEHGEPVAYSDDETHIYRFNGRPIGYIHEDSVWSYDGTHLGWFLEGWVVDEHGYRVLFTEESVGGPKLPVMHMATSKSQKKGSPKKQSREDPESKPRRLRNSWSSLSEKEFFRQ
jgi:hypothetical protein